MPPLPLMRRVRQVFPASAPLDLPAVIAAGLERLGPALRPGATVAVGVGSRGITGLDRLVALVVAGLRERGVRPFLFPAMGSHGGATPEGQLRLLASYGVTEAALGVAIRPSLEVRQVGVSAEGVPAYCSVEALGADAILLLNRVKPHTDFFSPTLGSGLIKMTVVGLGKQAGASAMHDAACRIGHETAIRGIWRVLRDATPLIGGLAVLEDQHHATARVTGVRAADFEAEEPELLATARALLPRLPFEEIDLLVVDRIGKNISGTGMDTNVINRSVHGYSAALAREGRPAPFIRRIFVRGLTEETHGNGVGIGLADVTTARVVRSLDQQAMAMNALTAMAPQSAKVPLWFADDREAIERTLGALALLPGEVPRVVRIADTLSVAQMEVSAALWPEVEGRAGLEFAGPPQPWTFDAEGHLREKPDTAEPA